ncbi:hypothetical protein bpSLO_001201 (plasmid) [Borrelia parkeri]|uniref:hypothetical protein n=1 Tax=Borrelia parkeri TaxID=141 RepID=UPI001FF419DD|nr:hypothetical protein [Borrelia parkeri]UPA11351.1 hypothetical protein bpSLO_001201 [Borrelia parkeri]
MTKKIVNIITRMRKAVKKLNKQQAIKVTDIIINEQSSVVNEKQAEINFLKSLYSCV